MALHAEVIGEQALYQKALGVIAQVIFPCFQLPLAVKDAVGIALAPEEALLGGMVVCSTARCEGDGEDDGETEVEAGGDPCASMAAR